MRNEDGKLFMGKAKNDITVNIKGATTVNIYFIDKFITCHKDDSNIAKIEVQQPRIQSLSKNICTHFINIYILCSYDIVLNKNISQSHG